MLFRKSFLAVALAVALATGAAQACELICLKSVGLYNGNLGGFAGADAKCVTEFGTGWKFPRSPSMVAAAASTAGGTYHMGLNRYLYAYGQGGFYAWTGTMVYNIGDVRNCTNWTTASSGDMGGALVNNSGAQLSVTSCDYQIPIMCCNM